MQDAQINTSTLSRICNHHVHAAAGQGNARADQKEGQQQAVESRYDRCEYQRTADDGQPPGNNAPRSEAVDEKAQNQHGCHIARLKAYGHQPRLADGEVIRRDQSG